MPTLPLSERLHQPFDPVTVGSVMAAETGGGKAFAQPEGTPARVCIKDGEVQPGSMPPTGKCLGMFKEAAAMACTLCPGAKQHQAKVGVIAFGKAVGHLGHAREAVIQKQAQTVAFSRIAVRGRVSEELRRLMRGIDPAFRQQPIIRRFTIELRDEPSFGRKKLTNSHGKS
jgi:hypothetical protein